MQTIRVALPIPKGTTPTITLEKSGLLSIAYYVRVQVFAQEGVYTTPDGTKSQFMLVDVPFVVGTLTTPLESPKSTPTTPISSPKSFKMPIYADINTEYLSRVTSSGSHNSFGMNSSSPPYPSTLTSSFFGVVPTFSTSATSNSRTNQSSTPITSPVLTNKSNENDSVASGGSTNGDGGTTTSVATLIDNKKGGRMMGGMFRKSSSGSNVSAENNKKTKKKNVFSSFKLYGRSNSGSNGSAKSKTPEEEKDNITVTDKNNTEERIEDQQKEENNIQIEDQATLCVSNEGGGVFDIFSGDDDDSFDEPKTGQEKSPEVERVFKMFPDDDDDEEEEQVEVEELKKPETGRGVFQLFPDSDDDDDEEESTVPLHGVSSENLNSTAATMEGLLTYEDNSVTNQRLLSSHVFKILDDSTDDENEESNVRGLSVSRPIATHVEEQKPNAKEEEQVCHKPDTIDDTDFLMDNTSDISSEEDEYDILGALARKEKLQRKIA